MLRNLLAEMTRKDVSRKDLAAIINKNEQSVSNKISCKTEFTRREMVDIRKIFFPNCTLDYLFEQEDGAPYKTKKGSKLNE